MLPRALEAQRNADGLEKMNLTKEKILEREQVLELIKVLFRTRFARDIDQLRPFVAPDIVYRMVGHRTHTPFSGVFRGPDAVMTGLRNLHIEFEFTNMSLDKVLIDGNDAGVRWHGRWKNRGTNASADFEGFAHLEFENGLVKSYTNFVDTALVANISGWG